MTAKWRELDLQGGGLQAANLRLARALRRRNVAWSLLLVFPLGAHRWYLGERRSAVLFPLLAAAAIICALAGWTAAALVVLLALGALLVHDVLTLERRLAETNKRLRMAHYLGQGAAAPPGYRGRFGAETEPADGTPPQRVPGFAEQEALLREIARRRSQ
jgi:hypothetical protein